MPEGHTIHRHARLQRKVLQSQRVHAWSPQGRFDDGAARIDGQTCLDIQAHGKHLLYHWGDDGGDGAGQPSGDVLHVHLGLFGRFRTFHDEPPPPTDGTRLALRVDQGDGQGSTIYLAGATIVDLVTPEEVPDIIDRLGPDPLDADADPTRFYQALSRRTVPICEALLDQKAIAGIGNVYRAELLFRAAIDPNTPAGEITEAQATDLWEDAVHLLRLGEKSGRIVTVEPDDVGRRRRSDLRRGERLYVYKRHDRPCHRCGTPIVQWEPRSRTIWACPVCQQTHGG
ncbi:Fpg/Nei family DNA glycosylase [Euzebya tangerina]|uniref:Fpg/Nei family DNA glycosylase n=1 Tax=Euzebya tangerina TaxID=591198 RepID=UPI000E31C9B8|nr:DNA-formamidopyrimidine glycosylase family protein [Euzebya tangerina]